MAATVIVLLVCELGLRTIVGLGHPLLIAPNPTYGYMPAPNQNLKRFFCHIMINSFGMRSEAITRDKPRGVRRILFVGDSVTFGTTYLDQQDIFTTRIQKDLREKALDTQVLNASGNGWAPGNELGFLKAQGTFDADLVVLVVNTNDLVQPFAPFVANVLNPTTDPPTAIGEALTRYILPRIFKGLQAHDAGSGEGDDPPIEEETPKIVSTLAAADQFALSHNAKFAIVFVPSAQAAVKKYQQHWDRGIAMMMEWAKAEHIPVLDMRSSFSENSPDKVYLDGLHLRPLGHQLIEQTFLSRYENIMRLSSLQRLAWPIS
jgi:lysophospholipase L1-like esterase